MLQDLLSSNSPDGYQTATKLSYVVLMEKEENNKIPRLGFKRLPNGHDLTAEYKLTLIEALLGYEFAFRHLDDRIIIIKSQPNTVVSAGDIYTISGEGMPLPKRPYEKGDLYLKFWVNMPEAKDLGTVENKEKLRALFPKVPELPKSDLGTDPEEYIAKPYDEEAHIAKQRAEQQQRRMRDEDDDDHPGHSHRTAECRTQ